LSLVYDWEPLEDEVEILGHPRLVVRISATAPVAYLCAKLCDVFEDGTSALVTRGLLNLTHRESSEEPSPLEPNAWFTAELELEVTSWTFERGHRIRLDLSGTDWPNAWPPPHHGRLTVDRDGALTLPELVGPSPADGAPALAPVGSPTTTDRREHGAGVVWRIEHDRLADETRAVVGTSTDVEASHDGVSFADRYTGTVGVAANRPGHAFARGEAAFELRFPDATVTSQVRSRVTSDPGAYRVELELRVGEGGRERWVRRWDRTFPRDAQ
jgi:hypothetical protein